VVAGAARGEHHEPRRRCLDPRGDLAHLSATVVEQPGQHLGLLGDLGGHQSAGRRAV
jgi:hypothetical protein